jgi:hypothetical protein
VCRCGTPNCEIAPGRTAFGGRKILSGWVADGFIDKQNRNVIPYRIDPTTLAALETLTIVLKDERFLAHGTHQNVQQIFRNHAVILRLPPASRLV